MRSLRSRFILSHILPIILVLPLVSLALLYLLETQILLREMADDLTERAEFIAEVVNRQPDAWQDPAAAQSLARSFALLVNGRLLILGSKGELLGSGNPELDDQFGQIQQFDGLSKALDGEVDVLMIYGYSNQSAEVLLPVSNINQELVGIIAVTQTLEGVGPLFARLRWFVLGLLGVELLISIIVAIILAARLEKPISQAAKAIIQVSEGDRTEPIPLSGPTEIRRLSEAVNILVERLRLLEETRRHLLANLVHELGRPLGAIRAAIHVLIQGAFEDDSTRDELLAGIEDEVIRLQPLLDDLAQLHGVVLGRVDLDRKPVNLNNWLPSIILPWRAAALEKGLIWSSDIPANLPTLNIDPERMGQAIGNLLSNGIKYTPVEGSVSLSARQEGAEILIIVTDSGPGIVLEEHEKIFEPFFRSSHDRRFPQGLGLGLTIARDMVEAHDGQLVVSSEEGRGSQFVIHLPSNGDMLAKS